MQSCCAFTHFLCFYCAMKQMSSLTMSCQVKNLRHIRSSKYADVFVSDITGFYSEVVKYVDKEKKTGYPCKENKVKVNLHSRLKCPQSTNSLKCAILAAANVESQEVKKYGSSPPRLQFSSVSHWQTSHTASSESQEQCSGSGDP